MAWTNSKIFMAFETHLQNNTTAMDMNADSIKTALYGTTPTPDQTVTSANTAYAVAQWVVGSELTSTGWPAGGNALASITSVFASNVYTFDANDRAGGASDTITACFGVEVYDDTIAAPVADQGICYNYLGGSNSVVAGTFTVVWHTSGIYILTL